jgi:hypothetical protein
MLRNVSKKPEKEKKTFLFDHFIHGAAGKFLHSHQCSSSSGEFIVRHYRCDLSAEYEDGVFMFSFAAMHMYWTYLQGMVVGKFTFPTVLKKSLHLHHQSV